MPVRRISKNDTGLVRQLRLAALKDSADSFADTYNDTQEKSNQYWKHLTESLCGEHVMFIAEDEGSPVGSVYGLCDSSNEVAGRVAGMWVTSSHRRRGFGKELLDHLVDWAESRGFLELRLWAPEHKAASIAFYEKSGFNITGVKSKTAKPTLEIVEMKRVLSLNE